MSNHNESSPNIIQPAPKVNLYHQRFKTIEQRFLEKVDKTSSTTGCWLWTGSMDPCGYGRFGIGRRLVTAHRQAYVFKHGAIPDGQCVLHRCDTPSCVNPDHLFLGTHADNMRDMAEKSRGRSATGDDHWTRKTPEKTRRGSNHGGAKLDEDKVRQIRILKKNGEGCLSIAARFGVNERTILHIVDGDSWKHVV